VVTVFITRMNAVLSFYVCMTVENNAIQPNVPTWYWAQQTSTTTLL